MVSNKTALLMLGCPELPVQTSLAIYLVNRLRGEGMETTIAGTPSALSLLRVSDPGKHYVQRMIDLDKCIEELAEKRQDFDLGFVFIHNDAGVSYLATLHSLSKALLIAIVFGRETDSLVEACSSMGCGFLAAKAIHNPMPLKNKIDEVREWAALKR